MSYAQDLAHDYAARRARLMNPAVVAVPTERPVVRQYAPDLSRIVALPAKPPAEAVRIVFRDVILVSSSRADLANTPATISQAETILREVCLSHRIRRNELLSARRDAALVRARHEACWRMKNETSLSYPQIGRLLGGRDHTTILHGVRKHAERMAARASA